SSDLGRLLGLLRAAAGLAGRLCGLLGHGTALVDRAPPALQLLGMEEGLGHHVSAEVLQLEPGPPALSAPEVPDVLEEALRVVLEHEDHPGEVGGERVEGHRSVDIALVAVGPPDDALVRDLLDDLRLPGAVRPEDLRLPGETLVALLLDVLDLLHEGREVLEAGPLVVDDVDRRPDVDRLDHVGDLLLVALGPPSGLAGEPFTDLGDALRQRA